MNRGQAQLSFALLLPCAVPGVSNSTSARKEPQNGPREATADG